MNKEAPMKDFTDYLAFLISALFSPYITSAVFIVIVTYAYSQSMSQFLPWVLTFLLFAIIIPGLYVLWLVETKKINDLHISDRKDRKIPFLISGISALVGTILLFFLDTARPVVVIAVIYTINTLALSLITQFWKISVHTALYSALVTITLIVFNPHLWWLYLILIPLGWSRIHRNRHTVLQAVAGALLAFVITSAVFWGFGYL